MCSLLPENLPSEFMINFFFLKSDLRSGLVGFNDLFIK